MRGGFSHEFTDFIHAFCTRFMGNVLSVRLYGYQTNIKSVGYLLIGKTFDNKQQNFHFLFCE